MVARSISIFLIWLIASLPVVSYAVIEIHSIKDIWLQRSISGKVIDDTGIPLSGVTCNKVTRAIKVYVNEEAEAKMEALLENHGGGATVAIGDGGGGKYECLIDYVAFEAEGAYVPEDLPISKILD